MEESRPEPTPPQSGPAGRSARGASRWRLPRLPVLIGMVGLGAVLTTGTLVKRRADARQHTELQAIRAEMSSSRASLADYRVRLRALREQADQLQGSALGARVEPDKSWTRERARHFGAFVARVERGADEAEFERLEREIDVACTRGDAAAAGAGLLRLSQVSFPSAARLAALRSELYLKPLAAFSRQTPDYYRAFQRHEPEAAKEDLTAFRAELEAMAIDTVTPQSMLKLEVFSAVAPKDDPLLADFASLISAPDYFDQPDAATLARWRQAQRAIRVADWPTAVAQMQSILKTTVRTRQPFRAAYARAVLKNTPDDAASAYAYLEEAAAAGDAGARAWVAEEDLKHGRKAQALRWLEAAALAGEKDSVAKLLELYALPRTALPRDVNREAGVLQRIETAPDAPALASMLLARLYEEGGGVARSPAEVFACYRRAAERQHVPAWPKLARCYLRGDGTATDLDAACDWACRALAAGELEESVPLLLELMNRAPDRTSSAVQLMFEQLQIAAPSGFSDTRLRGPGVAQLQLEVARYLDQAGNFAQAAKFYERSGSRDPAVAQRRGELTAVHPCETCGGAGKVPHATPCPTCGGKGTVVCASCDGRGYNFTPGSPPCTTCGGSGKVAQDGRTYACSSCGGTGKAKSSVIKQPCPNCVQGRATCRECVGGRRIVQKECPDCHGRGARALADE